MESFRHQPLGHGGPFILVVADALTMKVRERGRVVNVVVLLATRANGDGLREILGIRVAPVEAGAAWIEFFADIVARGLGGVQLATSDAHRAYARPSRRTRPERPGSGAAPTARRMR